MNSSRGLAEIDGEDHEQSVRTHADTECIGRRICKSRHRYVAQKSAVDVDNNVQLHVSIDARQPHDRIPMCRRSASRPHDKVHGEVCPGIVLNQQSSLT